MATKKEDGNGLTSAGHRLGQIVGDWWETSVVFPTLNNIAEELQLFIDNRAVERSCRGAKLHWLDDDNNAVDYDFVLELGGSKAERGVPVAFFESFWRSGARHSKDKARDDTNKLLPMRQTYATARFLAIAACGEFTEPARDYVLSRSVELLFVPKQHIVAAFKANNLTIDYPDNLPEPKKLELVDQLASRFLNKLEKSVYKSLLSIVGQTAFRGFETRVKGALTATPQEIRILAMRMSLPEVFNSIADASNFLDAPKFKESGGDERFVYEVSYSDGSQFSRTLPTIDAVRTMHNDLATLVSHMERVLA